MHLASQHGQSECSALRLRFVHQVQQGCACKFVVWGFVHVLHVLFLRVLRVRDLLDPFVLHIHSDICCMWFAVEEEALLPLGYTRGRGVVVHCTLWPVLEEDSLECAVS